MVTQWLQWLLVNESSTGAEARSVLQANRLLANPIQRTSCLKRVEASFLDGLRLLGVNVFICEVSLLRHSHKALARGCGGNRVQLFRRLVAQPLVDHLVCQRSGMRHAHVK